MGEDFGVRKAGGGQRWSPYQLALSAQGTCQGVSPPRNQKGLAPAGKGKAGQGSAGPGGARAEAAGCSQLRGRDTRPEQGSWVKLAPLPHTLGIRGVRLSVGGSRRNQD